MIRCNSGLGWNLSGGSRERVTPSQMRSVINVGGIFSWQDCIVASTALWEAAHPSESIMGLFKGAQRI